MTGQKENTAMSQTPYPPGPPPMNPPPGGAYGSPMPPGGQREGNGPAIAALVMGLLLCIPFVTGLGGIILGAVGIKRAGNPRVAGGGKGMAIAGLILGIVNLIIWGLFGSGIWALVAGTSEQRTIAKQFIKDLSEGNVSAATAACSSNVPQSLVAKQSQTMKSWGQLQDVTTVGINANANAGQGTQVIVSGGAQFSNGSRSFIIEFVQEGGKWKIRKFEFPGP
jgi:hypothetical protein